MIFSLKSAKMVSIYHPLSTLVRPIANRPGIPFENMLRAIAFGDIHMAVGQLRNIPGVETADLLIISGDLTHFGTRADAKKIIDEIKDVNSSVLAQIGNLDRLEINAYLDDLHLNLHGRACLFQDTVCCLGIGGSNITPFRTPMELPEAALLALGEQAFQQGLAYKAQTESMHVANLPMILVTQAPPFKTRLDRLHNGRHVG